MNRLLPSARHLGRALLLWIVFVLLFALFGGLGAGLVALVYELLFRAEFSDALYAVVFGVTGFIAYQLVQRARHGQ